MIKITIHDTYGATNITNSVEYGKIIFPSGEFKIKLKNSGEALTTSHTISIKARIKTIQGLWELALVKNALDKEIKSKSIMRDKPTISLYLYYLPYARQDRVCSTGESFSLEVVASLINSMNFNEVNLYDPHSSISELFISNSKVRAKNYIFNSLLKDKFTNPENVILSPDVGAYKEISQLSIDYKAANPIATGFKHRDLETGEITGVSIHGRVQNKNVVIIDDICDGGRTFIELAKLAKTKDLYNAKSVELIVTHGLFTKGLDVLKPYIDKIYTTNSYYEEESNEYIEVIKL